MQKNVVALRFAKSGYGPAEPRRFLVATAALAAALLLWPVECSLAQSPGGASTRTGTHLITLGTRVGPRPTAHQAQPSSLLVVNGTFYLIDAGDGVARRLAKAGIKFTDIGVIFITHVHSDHISGLGTLMAVERHHGRQDPIDVYGPYGVEAIVAATIQYFTPDAEIRWDEGLRGASMQDMFRGHDVGPGLVYQDANIEGDGRGEHALSSNPGQSGLRQTQIILLSVRNGGQSRGFHRRHRSVASGGASRRRGGHARLGGVGHR